MKILELRKKTPAELERLIIEWREKLDNIQFEKRSKKVKNVKAAGALKKNVARARTLLREQNRN